MQGLNSRIEEMKKEEGEEVEKLNQTYIEATANGEVMEKKFEKMDNHIARTVDLHRDTRSKRLLFNFWKSYYSKKKAKDQVIYFCRLIRTVTIATSFTTEEWFIEHSKPLNSMLKLTATKTMKREQKKEFR